MNLFRLSKLSALTALAVFGAGIDWESVAFAQEAADEDGVQILTRGPVHEAFAQTVTFNPEPGIVVPKAPPDAIEELPPDQRPEGDNVAWIPGYWAWDDDRSDFLWISGIWRALPPGRQWISGYWSQARTSFQWTSGYWADADLNENEYLPEPPDTVESGPNIAAPSANHIWTPGCWVWNENRYLWRPGYWVIAQQNWVWVPAQYLWSPRGYVFIDGYYDYSVARRGVIFAPVYFNQNVYARQGFTYSPTVAISLAVFGNQLFLRPNYNHYYYGDYYGSSYATAGFHPWFSFNSGRRGYDPIYAHQRWHHRDDREWEHRVESNYQHRRDHEESRPPRTLAAQQTLIQNNNTTIQTNNTTIVNNIVVATSLDQMAKSKDAPVRFQAVNQAEKQKLVNHGNDVRKFRSERQKLEAKPAETTGDTAAKDFKPIRVKLPASPILAKSFDQLDKDDAPPKRIETPMPDLNVEPKPRRGNVRVESPNSEPKVPNADTIPKRPKGRSQDEPKVDPKPMPKDPLKATPKDEPRPTPKVERRPERPQVEPKPLPKDEPRPAPRIEPMPAPRAEPKPTPRSDPNPKVERRPERPKVEPKPLPKDEPKPAPRIEPRPAPRAEPKPTPRVDPNPTPKVERQPERPRDEPKPAPKPAPRAEPNPVPKVEPKPAPRGEPKPTPKVEPKRERPRGEPKPAPRIEPKREPPQDKPRAKDKPKGDDNPK